MMQQYRELKRRFPDHLLLFRLGDFYELFADDAELGARLLSITLTARQSVPMAGIPHHAAEGYIARLVQAGQKIAICEQLEAPGKGRKLLRRDVVRVVTPGTLTDTAYLAGGANNFLLALAPAGAALGVALLDVSTGEFWVGEDADTEEGDGTDGSAEEDGTEGDTGTDAADSDDPSETTDEGSDVNDEDSSS